VPESPTAGEPVHLSVLNAPSAATDYHWKLAGNQEHRLRLTSTPRVTLQFETPGTERVTVLITDQGLTHRAKLTLRVRPHRPTAGLRADRARPRHEQSTGHEPRARAAADPGVTISDFRFTASTVTVHACQTITWTNDGPSSHTATARDGSFDTGILKKGASASHTFTRPGTFTYYCRIHPFMHGTVIVQPAITTPAASHTSSTSTTQHFGPTSTAPTQTVPAFEQRDLAVHRHECDRGGRFRIPAHRPRPDPTVWSVKPVAKVSSALTATVRRSDDPESQQPRGSRPRRDGSGVWGRCW
jgi:plastocyanin